MAKTATQLYKEKSRFIDESLSGFDKDLNRLQKALFDTVLTEFIAEMDVKDGVIQLTVKNARLLAQLDKVLNQFKLDQAYSTFSRLGSNMLKMTDLTSSYFNALVGGKKTISNIKDKIERYRAIVGIDQKGNIIPGSFLDNLADGGNLRTALSDYMRRAVEGQSDYKSFLNGFKELVQGSDEANGIYDRYVGGYVHDTFFAQAQQQDNFFAEQLGLTYFLYEGEEIKTTRPFCAARHGKIFSVEQGEAWNSLDWQGKIPGVDFFDQRGGYNCRHRIRWITDEMAQDEGVADVSDEE